MAPSRSFVGFGFGPIQSGLFLYEAFRTGRFKRLVVAEVDDRLVQSLRSSGGRYHLNIAHADRIEKVVIDGIEAYNPRDAQDRPALLDAIASADELATALPSVEFYARGEQASVASLLTEAFANAPAKPRVIYAAENNNHAAEVLTRALALRLPPPAMANLQVLNTVIGKMSGVITDADQICELDLAPLTPTSDRAVLVEVFNRILIDRISLSGFERGIDAFVEKNDLLPFEEAKLFGHNAIHALIGYLANQAGLLLMSDVAEHPDIMQVAKDAFIAESGAALVRKYAKLNDPVFTEAGYRAYAEDLLVRMVNPNLQDLVARVIRDPERKLGFGDRLFGTMRLALAQGITPTNMARGAAAAIEFHLGHRPASRDELHQALAPIWQENIGLPEAQQMIDLLDQATKETSGDAR